jgi:release factor glutamine methyltransferase
MNGDHTDLASLIRAGREAGLDRLDAELLIGSVLCIDRARILARPEHCPTLSQRRMILELFELRSRGIPFAHLVGRQGFMELDLEVTPDVLVPRPETELLVEMTLEVLGTEPRRIADLGTGSGAIALALARVRPRWSLVAVDRSPAALEIARRNALATGLDRQVRLMESDWYAGLGVDDLPLDAIVSNPPYVKRDDPDLAEDVARHEPELALISGDDGLDALRLLIAGAPSRLCQGGWILVEHGFDQGEAVRERMRAAGLEDIETRTDLAGHPRATRARTPDAPEPEPRKPESREPGSRKREA